VCVKSTGDLKWTLSLGGLTLCPLALKPIAIAVRDIIGRQSTLALRALRGLRTAMSPPLRSNEDNESGDKKTNVPVIRSERPPVQLAPPSEEEHYRENQTEVNRIEGTKDVQLFEARLSERNKRIHEK
jgi:hypothetical protein